MTPVVATANTPTEHLEVQVCALAAQLAASTCRYLLMIAELDRREAWAAWGCRSMAHWLAFRCGTSLSTAREQVRVGRALAGLPEIRQAFANGRLSYSKVRALVRMAPEQPERELIEMAEDATASQLERIAGAYVSATVDGARSQVDRRTLQLHTDEDGSLVVRIRMPADVGAIFTAALEAALKEVPADASADAHDPLTARRVDAFELIVRGTAPTTEVVVDTDVAALAHPELGEVARSESCDATITADGRRSRTIPRAMRRAIGRRDKRTCRFPGCTSRRYVHAHHIVHFAHGGPTSEENLILLCSFHHRLVHAGGWRVRGRANEKVAFVRPDGRLLDERAPIVRPSSPLAGAPPGANVATATGDKLDLDLAITALLSRMATQEAQAWDPVAGPDAA